MSPVLDLASDRDPDLAPDSATRLVTGLILEQDEKVLKADPRHPGLRRFLRNIPAVPGCLFLALLLSSLLFWPALVPYPDDVADAVRFDRMLSPPSAETWLGTDEAGRDIPPPHHGGDRQIPGPRPRSDFGRHSDRRAAGHFGGLWRRLDRADHQAHGLSFPRCRRWCRRLRSACCWGRA